MSIMIDLPPAMAQEAQSYARLDGTSLEKLFLDSLAAELTRRRETSKARADDKIDPRVRSLRGLIKISPGDRTGDELYDEMMDRYEALP